MGSQKIQLALLFLIWASLVCSSSCLLNEFSIVDHDSEERVVELFQRWKEKHQKVYKHAEEAKKRLENFKKNLKYIVEKNSKTKTTKKGHVVGLNKFADMSNEEFREVYISKVRRPASKKRNMQPKRMQGKANSCDAPGSLDWRKKGAVTGVKDQWSCGTRAMEGINAMATGHTASLSEQELVDCDSTNYGYEGSTMDYAFEWVINNGGYTTKEKDSKAVSIDGYEDVEASDTGLLCATLNQPISVAIHGSALDFQLYTSGIYDGECSSDPDDIDHAVLIVGYGSEDGEDYWIVKNSWGTYWGMEGYIYIRRNTDLPYGVCAINDMASYPTKQSSSVPPPSPTPPPPSLPPPQPLPPPSCPSLSQCGDFTKLVAIESCCCKNSLFGFCLIYTCCEGENAVCCIGGKYCCTRDYPYCDTDDKRFCLKNPKDYLGIAVKKRKKAKLNLPWN